MNFLTPHDLRLFKRENAIISLRIQEVESRFQLLVRLKFSKEEAILMTHRKEVRCWSQFPTLIKFLKQEELTSFPITLVLAGKSS